MTFVLDATNKRLRFTVSAGTDVHFTSHWADATASGFTEGQTQGVNTAGPDDVVPAPASSTRRVVKLITFHNTSATTSRTVTLVNDVDGTSRTIAVFTLAPLATWYSDTAATTTVIDRDYGDITVSGSGATWTIDNDAVTYAKMQNVSDGNRLLGRISGAGDVQEITTGTGILTWLQTPSSANLFSALTTKTGTGGDVVFSTAPTMTSPTISTGNLNLSNSDGNGQRITADMSNAVFTKRLYLQTNIANSFTALQIIPNTSSVGTVTANSAFSLHNSGHDFDNFERFFVSMQSGTAAVLNSQVVGSGTVRPIQFQTGSITRLQIENNGNIGFNGNSYAGGVGVLFIYNAATIPPAGTNPVNGGVLWVENGKLRYRGSGGTTTDIANA